MVLTITLNRSLLGARIHLTVICGALAELVHPSSPSRAVEAKLSHLRMNAIFGVGVLVRNNERIPSFYCKVTRVKTLITLPFS